MDTGYLDSEPEQQSMQWNERISQNCHLITMCNSIFFHVVCKQPTTAKMQKIFIGQKSYCAFCMSCSEPCCYKKQILF